MRKNCVSILSLRLYLQLGGEVMGDTSSGAIAVTRSVDVSSGISRGTSLPIVHDYSISEVRQFINQAVQTGDPADLTRARQISQYNEQRWQAEVNRMEQLITLEQARERPRQREIERWRSQLNRYRRGLSAMAAETRRINAAIRRNR